MERRSRPHRRTECETRADPPLFFHLLDSRLWFRHAFESHCPRRTLDLSLQLLHDARIAPARTRRMRADPRGGLRDAGGRQRKLAGRQQRRNVDVFRRRRHDARRLRNRRHSHPSAKHDLPTVHPRELLHGRHGVRHVVRGAPRLHAGLRDGRRHLRGELREHRPGRLLGVPRLRLVLVDVLHTGVPDAARVGGRGRGRARTARARAPRRVRTLTGVRYVLP